MKKVISLFLAVLMLVSVVPMAASAATSVLPDTLWLRYNRADSPCYRRCTAEMPHRSAFDC